MKILVTSLKILLIVLLLLVLSAFAFQQIMSLIEYYRYPPTGRFVEANGITMHIDCDGERKNPTDPIVLLEPGFSLSGVTWVNVQQLLSSKYRVCSYDRAGFGWSDTTHSTMDANSVAAQLNTLLHEAEESGPYIFVGHSMGGLYGQVFSELYSDRVQALVLIDPPSAIYPTGEKKAYFEDAQERSAGRLSFASNAAHFGFTRFIDQFWKPKSMLPENELATLKSHYANPNHISAMYKQLQGYTISMKQVKAVSNLQNIAVMVITAENEIHHLVQYGISKQDHELLAEKYQADLFTVPESDHYSLTLDYDIAQQMTQMILTWLSGQKPSQAAVN